ncbi:MAG: CoA-binding protein [Planctomycetales bacterium]|nr:CoA-binding protein [Planctomycetales bacterium]
MDISRDMAAIRKLLTEARRIAVVGCSPKPERDSHKIGRFLIEAGYDVVPVNPGHETLLDRRCYPDVRAIPEPVDIVDVFRSPDQVPPVAEDAIASRARALWLQLGVGNPEAEKRASDAGLLVVAEQCIMVAHRVLRIPPRAPGA